MSNREGGREPETIISASVKVEGDFVSQGNVLIEGEVEGSLKTEKDLRVGERARIAADICAASATVAGEIRGNLEVAGRLDLESTAKIYGDIKTADLVVASGAIINGKILMDGGVESVSAKATKAVKGIGGKTTKNKEKEDSLVPAVEELNQALDAEAAEEKEPKKTINAFFR